MDEFDRELGSLLQKVIDLSEACAVGEITDAQFNDEVQAVKQYIKQAVDKHVIGDDDDYRTGVEPFNSTSNVDAFWQAPARQILVSGNNRLRYSQRQSLRGGK